MLVLAACLLGLVCPLLLGGDVRRFAAIRLRAVWLPVVALLAQIVIIEIIPDASRPLLVAIHLATYVVAGAFIWINRGVPGLVIVGIGALLNGVTIALNDGTLPASAAAERMAGIEQSSGFVNSGTLAHPVLPWLGDMFAWPQPLPLANVFSIGDLLIVVGTWYAAFRICGTRWTHDTVESEGPDASPAPAPTLGVSAEG
jgi:hypothetical protein